MFQFVVLLCSLALLAQGVSVIDVQERDCVECAEPAPRPAAAQKAAPPRRDVQNPSRRPGWFFFEPRVDIEDTGKAMVIHADLPGVKPAELQLLIERPGVLTLIGSRTSRHEERGKTFHHVETETGRFERHFRVPFALKASQISAELSQGVLTVTVPKNSDETNRVNIVNKE